MSNTKFDISHKFKSKKSHKYYDDYEDDEFEDRPKNQVDKRKARRVERALKTKDINALIEDDDDFYDNLYHNERSKY